MPVSSTSLTSFVIINFKNGNKCPDPFNNLFLKKGEGGGGRGKGEGEEEERGERLDIK